MERHRRPKLEFIEFIASGPAEIPFLFKGQTKPTVKPVRFLVIAVGNDGRSTAVRPYLALFPTQKEEEGKWKTTIKLDKSDTTTGFVPIETYSSEPTEDELAYVLYEKGSTKVGGIEPTGSDKFILGYIFEDSGEFYLAGLPEGRPIRVSIPAVMHFAMVAKTISTFDNLNHNDSFLLSIQAKDDVMFTKVPLT